MGDFENKTDEWKGAAKENVGDLTDNEDLQAEGATEKTGAKMKQTAEDIKDNVEDAAETAKNKVKSAFD